MEMILSTSGITNGGQLGKTTPGAARLDGSEEWWACCLSPCWGKLYAAFGNLPPAHSSKMSPIVIGSGPMKWWHHLVKAEPLLGAAYPAWVPGTIRTPAVQHDKCVCVWGGPMWWELGGMLQQPQCCQPACNKQAYLTLSSVTVSIPHVTGIYSKAIIHNPNVVSTALCTGIHSWVACGLVGEPTYYA